MIQEKLRRSKARTGVATSPAMKTVIVQHILTAVEEVIYKELNMHIRLQVAEARKPAPTRDVGSLMQLVANALCMTMADYKGGRRRIHADLRCMACYIIKLLHPETPLVETANAMGIDHTSVIYHITRAKHYLATKEPQFVKKFESVINTLNNGN